MKTPSYHSFMDVFKMWQKRKSDGNQPDTTRILSYSNLKTTAFLVISLFINGVMTDEVKLVSVVEGDNVTLHTDTKIQRDDLIDWRFGDQQDRIAKLNKEANTSKLFDFVDERFSGRLKLNSQTGDLTIINVTTQHTGLYTLVINRKIHITKTFNISVSVNVINRKVDDQSSGSSSGVIAGLCVFLLVLVVALVVAVFLYKRLSRTTGNNWKDTTINEEETGKESAEMNKPLRTESPNNSDVP